MTLPYTLLKSSVCYLKIIFYVFIYLFAGWRTGIDTVKLLADNDDSTKVHHGWKQINTLEHFKIQDGASLVISRKPQQEDTIEKVDGNQTVVIF